MSSHENPTSTDEPRAAPAAPARRRSKQGWLLFAAGIVLGVAIGWWWRTPAPQPVASGPPVVTPPSEDQGHPLDPALELAREALEQIREKVRDYQATLTKRERIAGKLVEQKMLIKVRHRRMDGDDLAVPMSVYLKFLEPASVAGREVIWVEDRNSGKLVAHEGGFANLLRVNLAPKSMLAMVGNRYPITEIGIQNLVAKLIERGERDKQTGNCEVEFLDGKSVGDRDCRVIQVTHPVREPRYDFFRASIYIDEERNIPLRYSALVWPESEGEEPLLDEEYIYEEVELNVGLTDQDFDPDNENYNFP